MYFHCKQFVDGQGDKVSHDTEYDERKRKYQAVNLYCHTQRLRWQS